MSLTNPDAKISKDWNVSDAGFEISIVLHDLLMGEFPDRVQLDDLDDIHDVPHIEAPGHTILVCYEPGATVKTFAERILPTLIRDVHRQRKEQGKHYDDKDWGVTYQTECYGVYGDGVLVDQAARFEVAIEVVPRRADAS